MGIFKKSSAVHIDHMDVLSKVTITDDKVLFTIQYSETNMKPEDVPKLLADVMRLYALVKPTLDEKSLKATEDAEQDIKIEDINDTAPIDLSNIPF